KKRTRLPLVCFVLRVPLIFCFQHGNSGNFKNQECNGHRSDDRPPCSRDRKGDQEDSPPQKHFAEIVWVSSVSPQSGSNDPAFVHGIVSESYQLEITDSFKEKPCQPNKPADQIEISDRRVGIAVY